MWLSVASKYDCFGATVYSEMFRAGSLFGKIKMYTFLLTFFLWQLSVAIARKTSVLVELLIWLSMVVIIGVVFMTHFLPSVNSKLDLRGYWTPISRGFWQLFSCYLINREYIAMLWRYKYSLVICPLKIKTS